MSINSYTSDFYNENITKSNLKKLKSIELGHIFLFGNKYSKAFEFLIDGEKDKFYLLWVHMELEFQEYLQR